MRVLAAVRLLAVAMLALALCTAGIGASAASGTPSEPAPIRFERPSNLGKAVNSEEGFDGGPSISSNSLSLYFTSERSGGFGQSDLWVTTRTRPAAAFRRPRNLGRGVNSFRFDFAPEISPNGLSLFFAREDGDLWVSTRAAGSKPFGRARMLAAVNSSSQDDHPSLTGDGLALFFNSNRPGGFGDLDLWLATRPTASRPFGAATNLGRSVNSSALDGEPAVSADGLTLLFTSDRAGGLGGRDIWMTTRPTTSDDFGPPRNLGRPVNSRFDDGTPELSRDGSTLFFMSFRPGGPGGGDLWSARKRRQG